VRERCWHMTATDTLRRFAGLSDPTVSVLRPVRTLDIGVDLDGVVYDFARALRFYIHLTTGRPLADMPIPVSRWEFYEDWGYTLAEFLALFNAGVNSGVIFSVGRPFEGVGDGLRTLLADGHRIRIVTDRAANGNPGVAEAATRRYLVEHDLRYTSLTLSPDKTSVDTDVFIDDRDKNLWALRDHGTTIVVRDHAYNRHVDAITGRRVPDFATFGRFCQQLASVPA
jgi:hypothetical protein